MWDWSKCITWLNMPHLKLGNIQVVFPNIFKASQVLWKYWKDNKHNSPHLTWKHTNCNLHLVPKYAQISVHRHYLSQQANLQYSSSYAIWKLFAFQKRLCPQINIQAYFRSKWKLLFNILYTITKSMCAFWLVNQLWFIVPVNSPKNRASSELLYKSNKPQLFYGL